ncbi:sulfate ABC transporter substrate-binding protein [uncultured Dietzia sp.]|uniref:sulfate ABC transporter substrate-binding protein n=1 Tax=uncultured Dietzia sp. TaxID=395519 RepID=UPI00262388F9|nr:sulfate ABC transporter substrate-binding protein [uncultured Dietzia sp.]HMT50463.1 sulfate ABC transporter substrate-binding protein [Dietzia sp.]
MISRRTITRLGTSILGVGLTAALVAGCGGSASGDELSIVGFAVPAEGNAAVQAAFAETPDGEGTSWLTSYGASGDQSRAVANGQPADVVHFSVEPDVTRLVDAGLVDQGWNSGENKGFLTDSVVVLVVRQGNPKNITDWEDLARDDVEIVTPNPGSSGAARWNILAAWASVLQKGGTEAQAAEFLEAVIGNVAAFPGSGRDATTAFLDGTGDVLISYENEAILGKQQGQEYEYIVPDRSLLIQNPAAVTTSAPETAQRFLDFALSAEGQQIYARYGFRPLASVADRVDTSQIDGVADPSDPFPEVPELYTVDGDFGGWKAVVDTYFDDDGIITGIIRKSGLN